MATAPRIEIFFGGTGEVESNLKGLRGFYLLSYGGGVFYLEFICPDSVVVVLRLGMTILTVIYNQLSAVL